MSDENSSVAKWPAYRGDQPAIANRIQLMLCVTPAAFAPGNGADFSRDGDRAPGKRFWIVTCRCPFGVPPSSRVRTAPQATVSGRR